MPSFTVVITEADDRPITMNYTFKTHEDALNFAMSKKVIKRTIIYDENGKILDYIHPSGKRLDPNTIIVQNDESNN